VSLRPMEPTAPAAPVTRIGLACEDFVVIAIKRLEPGRARRATRCRDPERPRQPKPSREMVVVPVFESGRKLSTSAERFRGLATAYADAKLSK
jgi:hypothetical protein